MLGLHGVALRVVLFGGTCAAALSAQALMLEEPGPAPFSAYGLALAVIGDVDGDGRAEILVAAPFDSTPEITGTPTDGGYAGSVHLISGVDGEPVWSAEGVESSELFGWSVAGVGDVDGDGAGDALVGAPNYGDFRGRVVLFSGATGEVLLEKFGNSAGDRFGWAVAAVGDADGDGRGDFAVGAWNDADGLAGQGTVIVYSGAEDAQLLEAAGDHAHDHFGSALACPGDVDLDGVPDLAVGIESLDLAGAEPIDDVGGAQLISVQHGTALWNLIGDALEEGFGHSLAAPGDLTGDGAPDTLLGVPWANTFGTDAGKVLLVSGEGGAVVMTFEPPAWYGEFGAAMCSAGDLDEDGVLDVAIGAELAGDPASFGPGRVYVHSGASGDLLQTLTGPHPLGGFGLALAGADLDGDGAHDLVVGAPWEGTTPVGPGVVQVFSGDFWLPVGGGVGGAAGAPHFLTEGEPLAGSPVSFSLTGALPGAPALLIVGSSAIMAPFKGGTLVPNPDWLTTLFAVGFDGSLTFAGTWLPGPAPGMDLYFQWWVADPTAPHGWASTEGVHLTVP
jgi:FG-GAP repeat